MHGPELEEWRGSFRPSRIGAVALSAAAALAAGVALALGSVEVAVGIAFPGFVIVLLLLLMRGTVKVDEREVTIGFGRWLWPRKRISMSDVVSAEVVTVSPLRDFGGWGYRTAVDATGVVVRRGHALQLELASSGRRFVVTLDEADDGARAIRRVLGSRFSGSPE